MAGRKVKIFTDWRKVVQTLEDSYENLNGVPRPEWMMKDIIQNSWDARKDKSNAENWVFTISLIESKGSSIIVFEDEGTTGLTGKLTADEATKKLENGEELPPTERRARFYANAVTWSDGQDAAGGRGQGKGVLVIANSYESVVFESKSADGYFSGALVRDASGANMEDDETTPEEFADRHCPSLRPKKTSGVRIVLSNPDPDLVYAIETGEIDGHILASWWPLIATEGRIRIQVNGVSRELEATGAYENLVDSYRTNSPLEGHSVIKKPSKDDAIIGYNLAKSAVSVLELDQDDSDEDELDHRALGVHLIRQGMIVERYRLQESLLQLTYEIKNEHREAVCQGFYGYIEISGTEGNRELKRYENPLHYGFTGGRGGRVWKSVASYLEDPTRQALDEWGFLMDDDEAEIERDKAVQSAVQGEINKLARKLGINPSKSTVPGTSDGRNKPGGSPHLPIQIAIDNPKRGESLPKSQPVDGLLARVRNRQQCTVTVDVEYQLEVPGEEAKQLGQVEATIAASEEREFAIPTIPAAAVSEAGRYRLVATVRLKSAGNLEVLDKALLSGSGQVKMGWYRSDAVNLYIATPPPQKGLIDWVFESGSWYTPMEYVHDHKSPKVRVYEGSTVMKNAKINGDEAIASLYREIGLRALAGYVVTDEKALQELLTKTEIDDAESKGILAESIYFQLQSRM
jgi:hypothetical protein